MKLPIDLAIEYAKDPKHDRIGLAYLAGYEAAKDEVAPYIDHAYSDGFKDAMESKKVRGLISALEKLRDGPGNKMEGWKMTWAHDYATAALSTFHEGSKDDRP